MLPLGLPGDDTVDPMEEFGVNFWVGMVAVVVAEAADRADLAANYLSIGICKLFGFQ